MGRPRRISLCFNMFGTRATHTSPLHLSGGTLVAYIFHLSSKWWDSGYIIYNWKLEINKLRELTQKNKRKKKILETRCKDSRRIWRIQLHLRIGEIGGLFVGEFGEFIIMAQWARHIFHFTFYILHFTSK